MVTSFPQIKNVLLIQSLQHPRHRQKRQRSPRKTQARVLWSRNAKLSHDSSSSSRSPSWRQRAGRRRRRGQKLTQKAIGSSGLETVRTAERLRPDKIPGRVKLLNPSFAKFIPLRQVPTYCESTWMPSLQSAKEHVRNMQKAQNYHNCILPVVQRRQGPKTTPGRQDRLPKRSSA